MKVIYIATVLFSFFIFTACGGSDCEGSECFEPTDETSVTDDEEVADNTTDETVDETADEVVDEEPDTEEPDEGNVEEICVNFLDYAGDWTIVDMSFTGDVTLTLTVEDAECKISVTGTWSFSWKGTDLPLECGYYAEWNYFFYLVGKNEAGRMIWIKGWDNVSCKDAEEAMVITFERK